MDNLQFLRLIVIENGKYQEVASVNDAAKCLIFDWPAERGFDYAKAVEACHDALNGTSSPEAARTAFVAAAREAGILRE